MGRANYIILFICRYGGDAAVQILYSVGMVWGGLIILSCLFVGRGRCRNTDTNVFYSVGMVWGGLIILSCLFVGMGDAAI